ncbi:MAG: FtsX-like permease family protein [Planctomycetota bacterium]
MTIVHGVDKQKFDKFRYYNLSDKTLEEFRSCKDGAIAGATIAKRKGWRIGQEIDLREQLGIQFNITGTFFTGNEEQDNTVLVGFEYAQDSQNSRGWANLIYIKLHEDANTEAITKQIDSMPLSVKTKTQPEKSFMGSMLEDLNDMIQISRTVILITLIVVLAGIANTISMSVRDRTQQIGIMRTLGFSRGTILSLVLAESTLISVLGGLFGCMAAFILFRFQDVTVQARTYNFQVSLSWVVVLTGLLIAAAVGFIGGILPAVRASRLKIIEALRSID